MKVKRTGAQAHEALRRAVQDLQTKQARVGFFDTANYPDGTPVAYVATIQEFGYAAGGIPPRPFMRPTIQEQRNAWRQSLGRGAKAVLNDRLTVEQMLSQFGMSAAGDISRTISKVDTPPLADSTIAARQSKRKSPGVSRKPLVDTGLMIQSVSSDVVDK